MIETYDKLLNCNELLRNNWSLLTEAFIDFYGEDKREEITQKFSKALPIAYNSPDYIDRIIRDIKKNNSDTIYNSLAEKIPSNLTQEDIFGKQLIENYNSTPLYYFKSLYEDYNLGPEGRIEKFKEDSLKSIQRLLTKFTKEEYEEMIKTGVIPDFYANLHPIIKNNLEYYIDLSNAQGEYERKFKRVKELLEKINPEVKIDNIEETLNMDECKNLMKYIELMPLMIDEYNESMSKYKSFEEDIEKDKEAKSKIGDECYLKYVNDNRDFLMDDDLASLDAALEENSKSLLNSSIKKMFGYNIEFAGAFECFSSESEEILNDPNASDWKKDSIKKDRIKYYNLFGIDLGKNYEDYINNEEAKSVTPRKEKIDKLVESRKKRLNEYNNKYRLNLSAHKRRREEIDNLHLLNKDDCFDASLYSESLGSTFVSPNVVKTDNGFDLMSLVVIACNTQDGSIDHNIFHELNHLYEAHLIKADDTSCEVICGWDTFTDYFTDEAKELDTLNKNRDHRGYELFNEIINEKIAQEIYTKFLEKDKHIFDSKETAKVKNVTSYERTLILVNDFFDEFKEDIINSRANGNIDIILNKVGKENFDELNSLFYIFNERFGGFSYFNTLKDLQNNVENENTKIFKEIISKKNRIMENMRNYSLTQEEGRNR